MPGTIRSPAEGWKGGSSGGFLSGLDPEPTPLFPEGFSPEQRAILASAHRFMRERVLPHEERLEAQDHPLLRELLREAGAHGLLLADVDGETGAGLDKTSSLLVAEAMCLSGAWSVTWGAHLGLGTLPLVWFGSDEQKQRDLPRLVRGEAVAAYALTEPEAGSDALGIRTTARLSADGTHWILDGTKQFISNAAFADLFVVFAKVEKRGPTAFLVDRDTPGLSIGPEERKIGLRGSSTCPVILEGVRVPASRMLGRVGQGPQIVSCALNLGRLRLGVGSLGPMKEQLTGAVRHALQRRQFHSQLIRFPLIREKLARMLVDTHALESMAYRTTGLIDRWLQESAGAATSAAQAEIRAIEAFTLEASLLKIAGTEALGRVTDEALQIHGGYGYVEAGGVARAWRDQRINRIFEGTNEVNRLLAGSAVVRLAGRHAEAFQAIATRAAQGIIAPGPWPEAPLARAELAGARLKALVVYLAATATGALGGAIGRRQELLALLADLTSDAYALDSVCLRARAAGGGDAVRNAIASHLMLDIRPRAQDGGRRVVCASTPEEAWSQHLAVVTQLTDFPAADPTVARELIVDRLEQEGRYPFEP